MTKEFPPVPNPHPDELVLGPQRAAPIVGRLILAWSEMVREMEKGIYRFRMFGPEWPPVQHLRWFDDSFKEWSNEIFGDDEREKNKLHDKVRSLKIVRDDVAHNIWSVRLDIDRGVVINIVQRNQNIIKEKESYAAKAKRDPRRNPLTKPTFFKTVTYREENLERVIAEISEITSLMTKLQHEHFTRVERDLTR